MRLNFQEWLKLNEVGTGTDSIAGFQRITLPLRRRHILGVWDEEDPFFKKKKKEKNA